LQTITQKHGYGVAVPFMQHVQHSSAKNGTMPANEALRTITAHPKGGGIALTAPFFSTYYGAKRAGEARGCAASSQLGTQTTENRHALVSAFICRQFGNSIGHSASDPSGTITSSGMGKSQLLTPFLTKFRNGAIGSPILDPAPTVTASSWIKRPGGSQPLGIVAPVLTKHYGGVIGHEINKPAGTITTVDHHAVTAPVLVKYYGNDKDGQKLTDPVHTVTANDRFALSAAFLSHYYSSAADGGNGNLNHPTKTVTATGQHHAIIQAQISADFARFHYERTRRVACFLIRHGTKGFRQWSQMVDQYAREGYWLPVTVTAASETHVMTDIGMRMLQPRELFNAQGFPEDYKIDIEFNGRKLPKHAQVRMCGNSVSPPPAAALIAANVPELTINLTTQITEAAE
jgi:DNA (cytosine-5)-methyltransferase 1